jgi:hypothetical protein
MKRTNILRGQDAKVLNVKAHGTHSYHRKILRKNNVEDKKELNSK